MKVTIKGVGGVPLEPEIHFRRATLEDAKTVSVLATQVWLDTYAPWGVEGVFADYVLDALSVDTIARQLSAPDRFAVLAVLEEPASLAGFGIVQTGCATEFCAAPRQAELDRLYVQRPFHGTGLAAGLMEKIEQESVAEGVDALWLTPWIYNARARAFYAKHGFEDVGTAWFELDGKQHENRVLVKTLA